MFKILKLTPNDRLCDLGSGDGRVCLLASRDISCLSVGYEHEKELFDLAMNTEKWMKSGATFYNLDFNKIDLSQFNVIYVYLIPEEQRSSYPFETATVVFYDVLPKHAVPYETVEVDGHTLHFCGRRR